MSTSWVVVFRRGTRSIHRILQRQLRYEIGRIVQTVARLTTASYYSSCVTGRNPSAERAEPT